MDTLECKNISVQILKNKKRTLFTYKTWLLRTGSERKSRKKGIYKIRNNSVKLNKNYSLQGSDSCLMFPLQSRLHLLPEI